MWLQVMLLSESCKVKESLMNEKKIAIIFFVMIKIMIV